MLLELLCVCMCSAACGMLHAAVASVRCKYVKIVPRF